MSIKKIVLPNKKIRWEVYLRCPDSEQKRIRKRFNKKIQAQEFLYALKLNKRGAELKPTPIQQVTTEVVEKIFNEEADNWLRKKGPDFSPGTFRALSPALNKVRKFYGHYPVSKFTPEFLSDFRVSMRDEGLSRATQNRYVDIIIRIINFSYRLKRITFNPCEGYQKVREDRKEMLFWSEEETVAFLKFADEKYPPGSPHRWIYCAYLLALETGMRAREVWGLKVSDIPQTGTKLKVGRQILGTNRYQVTKGKDIRYVPFSGELKAEIRRYLDSRSGRGEALSAQQPLFVSRNGAAIDHDNFKSRHFRKDMKESGLRTIRFHDLRHTALTLMVKRGVILPVVQKIAGHKDIKTTMRYVHVLGSDIDAVGEQSILGYCQKTAFSK